MSTPIGQSGLPRITATAAAAALAVVGSSAVVSQFDDFLGDVVADQWNYTEGTDSATSAGAVLAGAPGGVFRMTTGDAGTGLAADMCQISGFLNFRASNGDLVFETRVKPSAITTWYLFVGFTDVITLEAPIESAGSANTLTSNAADGVGIMFDSRMAIDNFWAVGVKNDVDGIAVDTGVAPVAAEYNTIRVAVDKLGNASFSIDGVEVAYVANAITPTAVVCPTIAVSKTSVDASMNLDVDYIGASMKRV